MFTDRSPKASFPIFYPVSPNALLSNFFTFILLCNSSQPLKYPHLYFRLCISLLSSKISGESHIKALSPTMKSALALRRV